MNWQMQSNSVLNTKSSQSSAMFTEGTFLINRKQKQYKLNEASKVNMKGKLRPKTFGKHCYDNMDSKSHSA